MKVIVIGVLPESLINFRGELLKKMTRSGCSVIAMASQCQPDIVDKLTKLGVMMHSYPVDRKGINPFVDFKTLFFLRKYFRRKSPDIILSYTIKPIIWGGFSCFFIKKPKFFAMVEGLGFAFQGGNWKREILKKIIIFLYTIALKRAQFVIFLNNDNLNDFLHYSIISEKKAKLINGIGVNLSNYSLSPLPSKNKIIFLLIGRLLKEKGIREYSSAAVKVKNIYSNVEFQLLGPEDLSKDSISIEEIESLQNQGSIKYLGVSADVRPYIRSCHIYVLPSYHEGMPRTVLEAMAIGRPILTTDVPGCRETVINGENGYLVPKADANALAKRMIWFIENQDQWERMGQRSRQLAEEKYDVHKVNAQLMEIMGL